ncbi:ribose ABC transporter [Alphaproteobacteria bacterium]|jgi:L-fucose mutarotase|nr:ribose ABC transporter [Alphaproteobacteria bacterium]
MLINIDPNCTPELLYCLAQMGHGDELVIADRNFPANSTAAKTDFQQTIQMPGFSALTAIKTITSLLPLDGFVDHAAIRMEIDGQPDEMNESHQQVFAYLKTVIPNGAGLGHIPRLDFYARAKGAYAVVQTSEDIPYGCYLLRKGVIF